MQTGAAGGAFRSGGSLLGVPLTRGQLCGSIYVCLRNNSQTSYQKFSQECRETGTFDQYLVSRVLSILQRFLKRQRTCLADRSPNWSRRLLASAGMLNSGRPETKMRAYDMAACLISFWQAVLISKSLLDFDVQRRGTSLTNLNI